MWLWTVLLLTLLSAHTSEAVDEAELAELVRQILNVYRPTYRLHGDTPTFTLAASIPYNPTTRRYDVSQVTAADNGQTVRRTLDDCGVYEGNRVMGAMVLKWPDVKTQCPGATIPPEWSFVRELCPNVETWGSLGEQCTSSIGKKLARSPNGAVDHAEYRVLQRFNNFVNKLNNGQLNRNDLMLFYSYKAPCDARCASLTNRWSIVPSIPRINNWPQRVLVFSNVFVPVSTNINQETQKTSRRNALSNLGGAIGGLANIYRCPVGSVRCTSCVGATGVSDTCVSNDTRSRSPSPNGK